MAGTWTHRWQFYLWRRSAEVLLTKHLIRGEKQSLLGSHPRLNMMNEAPCCPLLVDTGNTWFQNHLHLTSSYFLLWPAGVRRPGTLVPKKCNIMEPCFLSHSNNQFANDVISFLSKAGNTADLIKHRHTDLMKELSRFQIYSFCYEL